MMSMDDGVVDGKDASLSPGGGFGRQAYVAQYDVNDDKKRSTSLTYVLVDVTTVDAGAAGAPTLAWHETDHRSDRSSSKNRSIC